MKGKEMLYILAVISLAELIVTKELGGSIFLWVLYGAYKASKLEN